MKNIFCSLFFLIASLSLLAQSNNQGATDKKLNSPKQTKGGGRCNITMHDLSLKTFPQISSNGSILLSWDNRHSISSNSRYNCGLLVRTTLERQIGNNGYDTLIVSNIADTFYLDTNIVIGLTYNYRLTRFSYMNRTNYVSLSDTVNLQIVGLEEEKNTISKVYPIPAKDFLFFDLDQSILGETYRILNISGQIVKEGIINSNKMQLNVQEFPQGFYFLKINESVKKFIISK